MAEFVYVPDYGSWIYASYFSDSFKELLTGYLEAAMFTHSSEMDKGYQQDITENSIKEAFEDCIIFHNSLKDLLETVKETCYLTWERLGNYILYSRNGEGTGFWELNSLAAQEIHERVSQWPEWSIELK